jgi:methionine-rich copper-binding protein CopC
MLTRRRQTAALLAVVVSSVLAIAAPAWAHTELLDTSPANQAEITAEITEVTLTFSGPVRGDGSTVTVTGPDGRSYHDGAPSVIDFVVHQPVTGLISGEYRVDWAVVAGDGHTMSGQFTFQVSLPAPPSPTEPAPTPTPETAVVSATSDDASPSMENRGWANWLPWLLAAVLIVGLAVLYGVRRARRR